MIEISDLPAVNATLNATSAVLLVSGYTCIRQKRVSAHRACMLGAFVASTLFLISYVTYHVHIGSKHFAGQGWVRPVYFAILLTHTLLAVVIVPLALTTLWRAVKNQFDRHKRIARWTFPLWLYVSVTGVIIYFMLYHWYAPA